MEEQKNILYTVYNYARSVILYIPYYKSVLSRKYRPELITMLPLIKNT